MHLRSSERFCFFVTCAAVLIVAMIVTSLPASAEGRFEGELIVKDLGDGRNFEVVQEFTYVDPLGVRWTVPKGMKTDGASVPRWAWSIFPPFAGRHFRAAVVHDYFCQTKSKPWTAVHRVFYDALRTAGVDWASAKTMYAAVYRFGPKWLPGGGRIRGAGTMSDTDAKSKLDSIESWIKTSDPSLKDIEKRMRDLQ